MKITHIVTGCELLRGLAVNRDSAIIGEALERAGLELTRIVHVGDDSGELASLFAVEARNCDVLVVTGGLGPTGDDLTCAAACAAFGLTARRDEGVASELAAYYRRRYPGRVPDEAFMRQALVPAGGRALLNPNGTAPGIAFSTGAGTQVLLLPGPPSEVAGLFESAMLPLIAAHPAAGERRFTRGFLVPGGGERVIESRIAGRLDSATRLAYCPSSEGTCVFVTAATPGRLADELERSRALLASLHPLAPGHLALAPEILERLSRRRWRLTAAESCTSGLIQAALGAVPGASQVFAGGVVAYANEVKESLLGVPHEVLSSHGAVSAACALAMVRGAAKVFGVEAAVSVTGIAGPDGGTPEKPVGLVYTAAYLNGLTSVRENHFRGDRAAVRGRAASRALLDLLELLDHADADAARG